MTCNTRFQDQQVETSVVIVIQCPSGIRDPLIIHKLTPSFSEGFSGLSTHPMPDHHFHRVTASKVRKLIFDPSPV